MQCFTFPCYLVPHRPKYLPSAPYNPHSVKDQVSHATDKIIVLYTLILIFLDSKQEDRRFWTEWQQAFNEFGLLLISA